MPAIENSVENTSSDVNDSSVTPELQQLTDSSTYDSQKTEKQAQDTNEENDTKEIKQENEVNEVDEINEDTSVDDLPLPGDEKADTKKSELPKWAEKRIAKKDREIQQKEAALAQQMLENERLKQMTSNLSVENNLSKESAPDRANFDSDHDYIAAVVHHENKKLYAKLTQEQQNNARLEKETAFKKGWLKSEEEGLKKFGDFDEKLEVLNSPYFPPNRPMAEAILHSPHKIEIQYFLGSYPEHAAKIAKMPAVQAIKEIAKLEFRLNEKKNRIVPKSAKIIEPIKGAKTGAPQVDPEKMSSEEFNTWYKLRKRS